MMRLSVRLEPLKSMEDVRAQFDHDSRRVLPRDERVDPQLSARNLLLYGGLEQAHAHAAIEELNADYKRDFKKRPRKDAAKLMAGLVSFGVDQSLDRIELRARLETPPIDHLRAFLRAICAHHHCKLVYAVWHGDEPDGVGHMHFALQNYDARQRKMISNIYAPHWVAKKNPQAGHQPLSQLQDLAAKAFEGSGFVRGIPRQLRMAAGDDVRQTRHRTVRELHEQLPRELEEAKARNAEQKRQFAAELRAVQGEVEALLARRVQSEEELGALRAHIDAKAAESARLQRELGDLRQRVAQSQLDLTAIEARRLESAALVKAAEARLADIERIEREWQAEPEAAPVQTVKVVTTGGFGILPATKEMRVVTEAQHQAQIKALRRVAASAKADAENSVQEMIRTERKRLEQDIEARRKALEQWQERLEVERKGFTRDGAILYAMLDEQLDAIRGQGGQTVACCSTGQTWRDQRLAMLHSSDARVIDEALEGWTLSRGASRALHAADSRRRTVIEDHGPKITVQRADTMGEMRRAAAAAVALAVSQGWPRDGVEIQGNPAWLHAAARAFLEAGFTLAPSLSAVEDAVREELEGDAEGESSDGGSVPAPPGSRPGGG
ncbi:MAG: hypothetical protein KGL42_16705 [Betaproteobacteria bacterium]|nr:hypothetical protein [Betaproteobacteria bacterium]